jgi:hypothetical protein
MAFGRGLRSDKDGGKPATLSDDQLVWNPKGRQDYIVGERGRASSTRLVQLRGMAQFVMRDIAR